MNGPLLGWFTAFLIALSVVLMLIIATVLLPRALRIRVARFHCPWKRRDVTVRYVTCDGETPVAVASCTAFADPGVVTCGTPCIGRDDPARVAPVAGPSGPPATERVHVGRA
jgi:hypothetical protein